MKVELISKTVGVNSYQNLNNSEIIAAVARHGSIKEDKGKLVKYLMEHKHWSPLQHISYGFKIETRRSISAQIMRHTSLEFQEWSLRYSEPLGFEDIELRKEHPTNRQSSTEVFDPMLFNYETISGVSEDYLASETVLTVLDDIRHCYNKLIEAGVAKECARDILPLCTKTTIHLTGTLRNLLSFLNVRHTEHAQKEVKLIASEIGVIIEKELPDVMNKIDWRNGYFM